MGMLEHRLDISQVIILRIYQQQQSRQFIIQSNILMSRKSDDQDLCQILISVHSSDEQSQDLHGSSHQQQHFNTQESKDFGDISQYEPKDEIENIYKKYAQPTHAKAQQSSSIYRNSRDSFSGLNDSQYEFSINQSVPIGPIKPTQQTYHIQKEDQIDCKKKQKHTYEANFINLQPQTLNQQHQQQSLKIPKQFITRSPYQIKNLLNQNDHKNQVHNLNDLLNKSINMESTDYKALTKEKKKSNQQAGIKIVKMGEALFYKQGQKQLQIDYQLMNQLAEYFLQQGVLIPLVNQSIFQSQYLKNFLTQLTLFLKSRKSEVFKKFFQQLNGKQKYMKKQKQQSSYFNYLKFNIFERKKYSKVQILCNTYISKLDSLKVIQQLTGDQLTKQIEQILNILGKLELLLSFEKAEQYCEQKSVNSIEKNIWKNRQLQIIKDRNWWITHNFNLIRL